ncbi:MAG: CpaF family protein [Actinobacteria bacterium]|nr:CpaF family protein [Actinomycetota bacterium]
MVLSNNMVNCSSNEGNSCIKNTDFSGSTIKRDQAEKDIIGLLKKRIRDDIKFFSDSFSSRQQYREKIYYMISDIANSSVAHAGLYIGDELLEKALSEIFGLGILENYLSDKKITDIFIQDRQMLIIRDGRKQFLGEVFNSIDDVYLIVDRIKLASGKTVDQRVPFLNAELYDGSRCSIVIPPVSDRVYITIRVFNCIDFELENLLGLKMFDDDAFTMLKKLVSDKKNILISGSTGSGKTTLLNTLVKLIPQNEIINLIQDLPEIRLKNHPFARMLTTRPKTRETDNEISQDRLVYETLRMKADRIILGEVRDCMAAYQLLQALNTGHRGSFSTIHADSCADALMRLEMLAMEYRPNLSSRLIKKTVSRAIDAVLFLECELDKNQDIKNRKIKEIAQVEDCLDKRGDYKLIFH